MVLNYLHKIGWFIGLVLLQVLILNNVHIAGYATPFLYIYLILKFESETPRNALMLWAFFLGLTVDIFSDTPGMNAADRKSTRLNSSHKVQSRMPSSA